MKKKTGMREERSKKGKEKREWRDEGKKKDVRRQGNN